MFKKGKYYVCIEDVPENVFYKKKKGVVFKIKKINKKGILVDFILPEQESNFFICLDKEDEIWFYPFFKQILKKDILIYAL